MDRVKGALKKDVIPAPASPRGEQAGIYTNKNEY